MGEKKRKETWNREQRLKILEIIINAVVILAAAGVGTNIIINNFNKLYSGCNLAEKLNVDTGDYGTGKP